MNLTVGPLAPAVYWRRRAFVAGALLVVVLLLVYSCGGASGSGATGQRRSGNTPATNSPDPTVSELRPQTGAPASEDPTSPAATPAGVAVGPAPTDSASEQCTDSEILLTPSVQRITGGTFAYELTLKIKNVSARTCKRDIGPNPQELHITQNGQTLWSSDSCQNGHGQPNVVSFGPGIEDTFKVGWDGTVGTACTGGRPAPAGAYQIVAKLDTKVSAPANFTIAGK